MRVRVDCVDTLVIYDPETGGIPTVEGRWSFYLKVPEAWGAELAKKLEQAVAGVYADMSRQQDEAMQRAIDAGEPYDPNRTMLLSFEHHVLSDEEAARRPWAKAVCHVVDESGARTSVDADGF